MSNIFGIDLLCNHKKKKYLNSIIKTSDNTDNTDILIDNSSDTKINENKENTKFNSLNKLNDILGLNEPDDNVVLLKLLNHRLNLGRERYGHGVRIDDDIGQYGPQGGNNWELMAEEELLDGMIYLGANLIRRRRERRLRYNTRKSNDDIIINPRTGELWNDIKRASWF